MIQTIINWADYDPACSGGIKFEYGGLDASMVLDRLPATSTMCWRDITAMEEEPSLIFNDDIKHWMNRDAKSREA